MWFSSRPWRNRGAHRWRHSSAGCTRSSSSCTPRAVTANLMLSCTAAWSTTSAQLSCTACAYRTCAGLALDLLPAHGATIYSAACFQATGRVQLRLTRQQQLHQVLSKAVRPTQSIRPRRIVTAAVKLSLVGSSGASVGLSPVMLAAVQQASPAAALVEAAAAALPLPLLMPLVCNRAVGI